MGNMHCRLGQCLLFFVILSIAVTLNEYGVLNHQQLQWFFINLSSLTTKETTMGFITDSVREIGQWPVDSPQKGPPMGKCFQFVSSSFRLGTGEIHIADRNKNKFATTTKCWCFAYVFYDDL